MKTGETYSSGKDVKITWHNVSKFMNGYPVIDMSQQVRVPSWFYSIAQFLFGRN